jgi:AraC family transcriptional regulator, regulatory protein of adaptative response / DNA-3-methyladenine glycosylase II
MACPAGFFFAGPSSVTCPKTASFSDLAAYHLGMVSDNAYIFYQALKSRDARFDGQFFTGVTSTGIYCRPVCRVKTPKAENCRFFAQAWQAESAGFRPCLRCRPELAPRDRKDAWSTEDASHTLALQAAHMLQETVQQQRDMSVADIAAGLGVSERHLRRICEAHLGVAPLQYLQTQRLLAAKALLTDTQLPITEVAASSGFSSLRRFNAAFLQHYRLAPTQLRKQNDQLSRKVIGATRHSETTHAEMFDASITIELGFRPPYHAQALLKFWQARQLDAIEYIANNQGFVPGSEAFLSKNGPSELVALIRSFQILHAGKLLRGWLHARPDLQKNVLHVRLADTLAPALPAITERLRAAFDLDADPAAIEATLGLHFKNSAGMRVPGSLEGFEIAVRAVLGQQVTVAAARTFTQRVVHSFGSPIQTPWPQITRCFPTPEQLACAKPEQLGALGIVRQRQAALIALSRAVAEGALPLNSPPKPMHVIEQLKALPGIGDWTAHYIAMRALRWPDAFPAGDIALHHALGLRDEKSPTKRARLAEQASQAWRPWRSYAVLRVWEGLHCSTQKTSKKP